MCFLHIHKSFHVCDAAPAPIRHMDEKAQLTRPFIFITCKTIIQFKQVTRLQQVGLRPKYLPYHSFVLGEHTNGFGNIP